MTFVWSFLYAALDIFPFLPLIYQTLGKDVERRRIHLAMGISAGITVLGGGLFALLYPGHAENVQWQLTFRELLAMLHLIPAIALTRVAFRKVIFTFTVIVPVSLLTISVSYLASYLPSSAILYTRPCMEEVLLRAALILLIYLPLRYFLRRILRPAMDIASEQIWSLIWLVPLFLAALSLLFSHHYFHTDYYLLFVVLRLFVTMGCLVCCAVLLQSLKYMEGYAAARAESEQSRRLLGIQAEQYRIVTDTIAQTRALRHDLRHQMIMIRNLTTDGKYDQLLQFVNEYAASPALNVELSVCDNYVVNSLVIHYISMAREKGIDIAVSISALGENLSVSDTDLCILIGNSLENAIEACSKVLDGEKTIRMHMKRMGGHLTMALDNTYGGSLKQIGDRFISTKREGEQEGIGIRSIRSIAEKYGGDIRIEHDERTFKLSVILLLKE